MENSRNVKNIYFGVIVTYACLSVSVISHFFPFVTLPSLTTRSALPLIRSSDRVIRFCQGVETRQDKKLIPFFLSKEQNSVARVGSFELLSKCRKQRRNVCVPSWKPFTASSTIPNYLLSVSLSVTSIDLSELSKEK